MMKYSGIVVLSTAAIALHGCGDKDEDVKATEAVYKSELDAMKEATKKAKEAWEAKGKNEPDAAKKATAEKEARKFCEDAKAATDKKVKEAKGKKDEKDEKKSSFVQEKKDEKKDEKKTTPEKDAWTLEYETCKALGVEKEGVTGQ